MPPRLPSHWPPFHRHPCLRPHHRRRLTSGHHRLSYLSWGPAPQVPTHRSCITYYPPVLLNTSPCAVPCDLAPPPPHMGFTVTHSWLHLHLVFCHMFNFNISTPASPPHFKRGRNCQDSLNNTWRGRTTTQRARTLDVIIYDHNVL